MAITYQSISTLATKTTTTNGSLTLNAPAGVATDDLLVACISFRGATTPSIPVGWTIVNRTTVTGNTSTTTTSIGSGLMAWIRRGATNPSFVFGATTGQQFSNIAFGYVIRITGQDLTNPLAGTSVNTLASSLSAGEFTTGGYERSFRTDSPGDYIDILMAMGAQETTWSGAEYSYKSIPFSLNQFSEIGEATTTSGADGSISVARNLSVNPTTSGFGAVCETVAAAGRHALMAASFGGPRSPFQGYSFSTLT